MNVTSNVIAAKDRKTITGTAQVTTKARMVIAITGFSAAYFLHDSQKLWTAGGTRNEDILWPEIFQKCVHLVSKIFKI